MVKRIFILLVTVIMSFSLLAACSAKADYDSGSNTENESGADSGLVMPSGDNRKIVYKVNARIETSDFDNALNSIFAEVIVAEGFTGSYEISQSNGKKYAYLVLRIKTENLNPFLEKFSVFGDVKSQNLTSEDITSQYNDVDAELKALQAALALLQSKMEEETDPNVVLRYLEDITKLNQRIKYYQNQLASYDLLIEYSTVNITLYEKGVAAAVTQNFGSELGSTFTGSLSSLLRVLQIILLILVAVAPYAAVAALIFIAVHYIRKYLKKRYPERYEAKKQAKAKNRAVTYNPYNNCGGNINPQSFAPRQDIPCNQSLPDTEKAEGNKENKHL